MLHSIRLPSYREQSPEVRRRFENLRKRGIILEVENLSKSFRVGKEIRCALEEVSFQVHRREFLSVIGPSGCGKSTLVRILAGLDEASSGRITLAGTPISGSGPERGMVFQNYSLFPWLTVLKNVMFGLTINGMGQALAQQEALTWIELIGLKDYQDYYPYQLSGGMKQRVAIARALANRPKILLMDEPFGALDAQTRARMQAYLLEIWRNVDITIVFITHDLDEAIYLSDRIAVLQAHPGRLVEIIEVPVPHPREQRQFLTGEFLATKKRLEELIHPAVGEEDEHLTMLKMTLEGDEVI